VGQADRELSEPLPQVAFCVRGCLPGGFQDLVGVEGHAFVQQSLRFNQTVAR
jgi:hypothetical protein